MGGGGGEMASDLEARWRLDLNNDNKKQIRIAPITTSMARPRRRPKSNASKGYHGAQWEPARFNFVSMGRACSPRRWFD